MSTLCTLNYSYSLINEQTNRDEIKEIQLLLVHAVRHRTWSLLLSIIILFQFLFASSIAARGYFLRLLPLCTVIWFMIEANNAGCSMIIMNAVRRHICSETFPSFKKSNEIRIQKTKHIYIVNHSHFYSHWLHTSHVCFIHCIPYRKRRSLRYLSDDVDN